MILSLGELAQRLRQAISSQDYSVAGGHDYLIVDARHDDWPLQHWTQPNCPVLGIADQAQQLPEVVDVWLPTEQDIDTVVPIINNHPIASAVLVQVLRYNEQADVASGLLMESLAYSSLQHSHSFMQWQRAHTRKVTAEQSSPLDIQRINDTLTLSFTRPQQHNAYSQALHRTLWEALATAQADVTIRNITLRGTGPSFCAGGDLNEFGLATDAGLAHLSRMTHSVATLIHQLSQRPGTAVTCELHGACIGAGIELPAFASFVTAHPDSFFQLPELSMGLIPGAGGTVSITKRIGRQKAAYLSFTQQRLDASTALAWGLVDEVSAA